MPHIFNHIRDPIDKRDHVFQSFLAIDLPKKVDLSNYFPPIMDQGNLGTCAAHSIVYAVMYCLNRINNHTEFSTLPSRLFLYTNARLLDNLDIAQDTGCTIRSMYKACSKYFSCDETVWKYKRSNAFVKPPVCIYQSALINHQLFQYVSVPQALSSLKACLAQGYPISFGMQLYESFQGETCMKTGIVPIPNTEKEQLLGGHALTICGYDDTTQMFLIANSWGTKVGLRGYFKVPYAVIVNRSLCSDFWSPRLFQ